MLKWVEAETRQRHWMERSFVYYRFAALVGSLLLAAVVLVGGIWLIDRGKSPYGLIAILAALGTFVGVFLIRQFRNGQE